MTIDELRAILQSDFSLWEQSQTLDEDEKGLTKTVMLPYNIGQFTIRFEGINNAETRRGAVAAWGDSIRDAVETAIGEESVSARAAQKAARASYDDGGDGGLGSPDTHDAREEAVVEKEAVQASISPPTLSAEPSDRLNELIGFRNDLTKRIKGLDLEIKALTAYVEVLNECSQPDKVSSVEGVEGDPS